MSESEQYRRECEAQLGEWKQEVDRLWIEASHLPEETREKAYKQLEDLQHCVDDGQARVSEMDEADDGAWAAAKEDARDAWNMVRSAFEKNREAYMHDYRP